MCVGSDAVQVAQLGFMNIVTIANWGSKPTKISGSAPCTKYPVVNSGLLNLFNLQWCNKSARPKIKCGSLPYTNALHVLIII